MQDACIYQIDVQGKVCEKTFDANSPFRVKVIPIEQDVSQMLVNTDQSGLIGLLRYLHSQGFLIISVRRSKEDTSSR